MQNHRNRPRDRRESRVQPFEISADIVVWSVVLPPGKRAFCPVAVIEEYGFLTWTVPYSPGTLAARAYSNESTTLVASKVVATTGQ